MGSLFETGIRPLVDDFLLKKSKEVRNYGEYWSASSAGYCMRKNIFERLGVPHIETDSDARKQRVFQSGHIFHQFIQELTKEAGLSVAQEVELQDEGLMIRGHFDDLVLVTRGFEPGEAIPIKNTKDPSEELKNAQKHLILYDYKTVNSRSFLWAKKNNNAMSHYHRLQLGTYMYMLRKRNTLKHELYDGIEDLSEARILKIEKDTLMMSEQQLLWTPDLERDVVGYWRTLNGYWEKKTLPKCTCADYEGGFMSRERFNPYFYNDTPCSLEWYELCKKEGKLKNDRVQVS